MTRQCRVVATLAVGSDGPDKLVRRLLLGGERWEEAGEAALTAVISPAEQRDACHVPDKTLQCGRGWVSCPLRLRPGAEIGSFVDENMWRACERNYITAV